MVRVVSCRYMRISCSEEDHPLFRRYYARSNRERGIKLLRCFPHCCPEHVQRCYCGSSIHVLVTFAAELPAASQGNLVVCARFEPSQVVPLWPTNLASAPSVEGDEAASQANQRKLQPGEVVSLPASLLCASGRQPRTKDAVWIRAGREGEMKQKSKDSILYVLNHHRFPKWLYSYDSSVTRTQREMTHHLVAYVFQLTGTRSQPGEVDATVLARHESPGFSLISYRRSGNNSSDAGCDLPALDMNPSRQFTAVGVDTSDGVFPSPTDGMEIDSAGWTSTRPTSQTYNQLETKQSHNQFSCQVHQQQKQENHHQTFRQSGDAGRPGVSLPPATTDKFSWQHTSDALNCGFRDKGQHLLILWHFLQRVSFSDLGFGTNTMSAHIRSHWLRAATSLRTPSPSRQLNCEMVSFLSEVLNRASSSIGASSRESMVIRVTVHLFLRALSSRAMQRMWCLACTTTGTATSRAHLQNQFVLLISDLYAAVVDVLREVSAYPANTLPGVVNFSLPALVDEVLSLVYGRQRFCELRVKITALLMGREAGISLSEALDYAFRTFTALAREAMFASATQYRGSHRQRCYSVRPEDAELLWNQRWLFEPGSVQVVPMASGAPGHFLRDLSLVDVVQFFYEFVCVDITMEDNGACLSVRSSLSFSATAPMVLVLDGKLRVFHVLPSGVTSMIETAGGWSVGDYTARLSDNEHSLDVDLFSFAGEKAGVARDSARPMGPQTQGPDANDNSIPLRRVSLSIRLDEELSAGGSANPRDLFAFLRGTVYGATYSSSMKQMDVLSEKPTTERAAVWNKAEWTPLWDVQAGYIALPRVGFV